MANPQATPAQTSRTALVDILRKASEGLSVIAPSAFPYPPMYPLHSLLRYHMDSAKLDQDQRSWMPYIAHYVERSEGPMMDAEVGWW
jgi:hypothetical protein